MVRSLICALLMFAPALAYADRVSAAACAGALPPDAKTIYNAAAPEFLAAPDPAAEVKNKTRDLVMQGKVGRASARDNAVAAGECLKKLR